MSPSLLLDNTSDISFCPPSRTLLLAPPSIAAHEESLRNVLSCFDRAVTDLQMLDRLSTGIAKLPQSTYDLILILNDANGTSSESLQYLNRNNFQQISNALKAGGRVEAQDKTLGQDHNSTEFREAILAGLILDEGGMVKPKYSPSDTVPIKILKGRGKNNAFSNTGPTTRDAVNSLNISADTPLKNLESRTNESRTLNNNVKPGFIDNEDEELIDEDTLLTEEEVNRPLNIPLKCAPRAGKRRRACKDCTCGLAQKLAAEDAARISAADAQLRVLKLEADELAEVDFTIQGKVGSCGNCSLGDAFRCVSCPYIGMPAFKPGEEVRLLNNDAEF
ncbi:Fe-S cluster assembly protein DRE2 [Erysiphe necator]|nr:Fe-S cluster assembly protein DRE2 [Erysiphe necator]